MIKGINSQQNKKNTWSEARNPNPKTQISLENMHRQHIKEQCFDNKIGPAPCSTFNFLN